MVIIIYTNSDKVRTLLGIDSNDLSDTQATDRQLDIELELDLRGWIPNHAALYAASVISSDTSLADGLTLYCTYFAALSMVPTLRLIATQTVSDGKNSLGRFTPMDWDRLEAQLSDRLAKYRDILKDLAALPDSESIQDFKQFSAVGLVTDPVTGG